MEENTKIQSTLSPPFVPITAAPSQAAPDSFKPSDATMSHDDSGSESRSHCSSESNSKQDNEGSLDGQYLDMLVRLQQLVRQTISWREEKCHHQKTSSTRSDIHSLLDTALTDLHVWTSELSDNTDSFLENFRSLKNCNHALNERLQRRVIKIGQLLTSIDQEVHDETSRPSDFELVLQNCQKIYVLVNQLKGLKPDLKKNISTWSSARHTLPTDQISQSQHAVVLCFDGGGVKSYASLLILKKLMEYVNLEICRQPHTSPQDTPKKPCDVFNFMYGSSSGGLIAIMLGRLEMTLDDCIQRFSAYANTVFSHPRLGSRLALTSKYSEKTLVEATRSIVGEFDPTPNSEKWRRNVFSVPGGQCKTGVLATAVSGTVLSPYMFRTYDCIPKPAIYSPKRMPSNPGPASDLQIWEIVRATSAAPLFFPQMKVQDQVFVDGGLTTNNPCQDALRDIAFLHQDRLKDTCLVSIGSGIFRGQHLSTPVLGIKHMIRGWRNTVQLLRSIVMQTQTTNTDVHEISLDHGFPYFRFDPDLDRHILLDEWIKPRRSSRLQTGTLRDIDRLTDNYLQTEEVKAKLRQCASAIVLYKLRANSGGSGPHFFIPFERNQRFVGRSSEINLLETVLFRYDRYEKIAIYGLGGIGKTQIALELAYRTRERRPACSIFWIQASSVEKVEQAYLEIGQLLQIPGLTDEKADVKQLVKLKLGQESEGQWLFILDNADDADIWFQNPGRGSQATALIDYLPKSSKGSVVFTTRDRKAALKMAGTNVLEISSMDESFATDLLENSLIRPTGTEEEKVRSKLLNLLTYLPLAIVQAAAYINANDVSMSEYLSLVEDTEDNVVEILSEDFEDNGRYRDSKNVVATTWLISFEQIRRHDPLAAEYLCFMSCLDTQMIPQSLLPPAQPMKRVVDAIGTLLAHSFITKREINQSFDLHRLIHLATRNWLKTQNALDAWTAKTVARLVDVFPTNDYRNKSLWATYLPHARYVLKSYHFEESSEETWLLLRKVGLCLLADGMYFEAEGPFAQMMELSSRFLGEEHPDSLTSMSDMALTYRNQGRWAEAEALEVRVLDTRKRVLGEDHPDTLTSIGNLASTYRDQGRWKEAEDLDTHVMETRKIVLGQEHPATLTSMANLASIYWNQGRWKEAEDLDLQAMETSLRVLGQEHPDTLTGMSNLALIYRDQGRWKEAEDLFVQVMETSKRVLGEEHPSTLTSMANLASTYQNQGRWKEAEDLFVQVMETSKRVLGEEHPSTLTSIANLASTYQNQGRLSEAEDLELQVVETSKRVLGKEHPSTLMSMANLASTYQNQGCLKEAEDLELQVVETSKRVLGEEHPSTLTSMANLASTYQNQGCLKEAEDLELQVMETSKRVLGEEHPSTLTSIANLASTYQNQGRLKEAEDLELQVVETSKRVLGKEHPSTLTSMANLASTYQNQGRWKEAEDLELQVMETSKRVLGEEHPSTLTSMNNLAFTWQGYGRHADALKLIEECAIVQTRILGASHPHTLSSRTALLEWQTEMASISLPNQKFVYDELPDHSIRLVEMSKQENEPNRIVLQL